MNIRIICLVLCGSISNLLALSASAQDPPDGWLCESEWYGDGGCDCGCYALDIDCGSHLTAPYCEWSACGDGEYPKWDDNTVCLEKGSDPLLPEGWDCSSAGWANGECDCGCGVMDPECGGLSATECYHDRCDINEYPAYEDNRVCIEIGMDTDLPTFWDCGSYYYGDAYSCECGCGDLDPDCIDASVHSCDLNMCYDETDESAAPFYPGFNSNIECFAPGDDPDISGWMCDPSWMDDGYCDCGCGIVDGDCESASASDCFDNQCMADEVVVSDNNALCETPNQTGTDSTEDTETDVDTETGGDTVVSSDSGADSDTDSDTTVVSTDSGTDTGTGSDTATADTETGTGFDSDTGIDTSTTTSEDSGVVTPDSAVDTSTIPDTTTGVGTDTTTTPAADTTSDSTVITGRPQTENEAPVTPEKEKQSSGSLFGCAVSPGAPAPSVFQILF